MKKKGRDEVLMQSRRSRRKLETNVASDSRLCGVYFFVMVLLVVCTVATLAVTTPTINEENAYAYMT